MINVSISGLVFQNGFFLNVSSDFVEILAEGHSLFLERGEDVVCAAVSVLVQTTVLSIAKIVGLSQDLVQRDGFLRSLMNVEELDKVKILQLEVLLGSMVIGILEIEKKYPDNVNLILNN